MDNSTPKDDQRFTDSLAESTDPTIESEESVHDSVLVAYLDGELSTKEVDDVEHRLATDHEFRDRLIALQRTWDMLDLIPKEETSESFTRSTVELVTQSLETELRSSRNRSNLRKLSMFGLVGVMGLTSMFVGYAWIQWQQGAENRELVEDLPVIENVDLYRNADSISFLERLSEEGLFDDE